MSKIARVVHASPETEVFILEPDPTGSDGKRFTIVDAPDALEVKGLGFSVAPFCLLSDVPAFYWLQDGDASSIKDMIRHAVSHPRSSHLSNLVGTAAFLGKKFYDSVIHQLGDRASKLSGRFRTYPADGPATLMGGDLSQYKRAYGKLRHEYLHDLILEELNVIAKTAKEQRREPEILKRSSAVAFDCYLYARDDRYAKK